MLKKSMLAVSVALSALAIASSAYAAPSQTSAVEKSTASALADVEFVNLTVGDTYQMKPTGSAYEYQLYSSYEIYVSKTGLVKTYGTGFAEGRVYNKSTGKQVKTYNFTVSN